MKISIIAPLRNSTDFLKDNLRSIQNHILELSFHGGCKIENDVWAKAIVCPGVTVKGHSVITAGSVVTNDTEPYTVYQGNPAREIRKREVF